MSTSARGTAADALEFLVERMARSLYTSLGGSMHHVDELWEHRDDGALDVHRDMARAALAVVVGTPDEPGGPCNCGTSPPPEGGHWPSCPASPQSRVPGTAPARRPCATCDGTRNVGLHRGWAVGPCLDCQDGFSPIPAVLECLGAEQVGGWLLAPNVYRFPRQLGVQHDVPNPEGLGTPARMRNIPQEGEQT